MYVTVRRYEGVANSQEMTGRVEAGFLSLVSAMTGFVRYYWVDLGYGAMLSVSLFDSLPSSTAANQSASRWIRANLTPFLKQDPRSEGGEVLAYKSVDAASRARSGATPIAALAGKVSGTLPERAQLVKPHLTVRRYEGVTSHPEAAKQIRESFVPVIAALPGFNSYYWADVGSAALSVSIFDSFSHGVESGQTAASWVRTNLAAVLPQNPRIESGRVVSTI
jgi:hypothetical protein